MVISEKMLFEMIQNLYYTESILSNYMITVCMFYISHKFISLSTQQVGDFEVILDESVRGAHFIRGSVVEVTGSTSEVPVKYQLTTENSP